MEIIPVKSSSNWWSRNWKWFVPVGCLSLFIIIAGITYGIISFFLGLMKSSDVYTEAVERAKYNAEVIEALGTPIKDGLIYSGKIVVHGDSGKADISIPLRGPKGKASVRAAAIKSSGKWTFGFLEVVIDDSGKKIDLLYESKYF